MTGEAAAFLRGESVRAWKEFGAHLTDEGTFFRVWAPGAAAVSVVGDFNGWDGAAHPMENENGIWSCLIPGLREYDAYKYRVTASDGRVFDKADPFAFHAETRPGTASKLFRLEGYLWEDGSWMRYRRENPVYERPMYIYEAHLGSFRRYPDGNPLGYRALADALIGHAKSLGATHLELLPVTEHPLDDSWGYQCSGFFAATSRFGTPHDFMYFIDRCHRAGLGVLLDWVPAHFVKDAHGLFEFDGALCFEYADPLLREHEGWGTRVFDYGKPEVVSFLTSSALFWLEEFHLDGLRVDAVASMLYRDYGRKAGAWRPNRYGGRENLEAVALLRHVNTEAFLACPGIVMAAEESTAWPLVSRPADEGGLGFNLKWNMGWMNDALHYFSLDPIARQYNHRDLTFPLMYAFSENFILPVSHDEVVHGKKSLLDKMPGEYEEKFAGLRAFFAYMLAHPGKKLLFMGAEFGQFSEWASGRALDWDLLEYPMHRKTLDFFRAAGAAYLRETPLWELDFSPAGFRWLCVDDKNGNTLAFLRFDKSGATLAALFNFSPVHRRGYRLGLPEKGAWRVVLDTDEARFGGSGLGGETLVTEDVPCHGCEQSAQVDLPPLAGLWLAPSPSEEA